MSQLAVRDFLDRFPHAFQEGDPLAAQKQMEAADGAPRLQEMYRGICARRLPGVFGRPGPGRRAGDRRRPGDPV